MKLHTENYSGITAIIISRTILLLHLKIDHHIKHHACSYGIIIVHNFYVRNTENPQNLMPLKYVRIIKVYSYIWFTYVICTIITC